MIPKFRGDKSDATGVCALVLAAMRKDAVKGSPSNPRKRKQCKVTRRKRKLFEDTPKRRRRNLPAPMQAHTTPKAAEQKTDDPFMATPVVTAHWTDDLITPDVVQPPPTEKKITLMATPVVTAHQADDPITPGVVQHPLPTSTQTNASPKVENVATPPPQEVHPGPDGNNVACPLSRDDTTDTSKKKGKCHEKRSRKKSSSTKAI